MYVIILISRTHGSNWAVCLFWHKILWPRRRCRRSENFGTDKPVTIRNPATATLIPDWMYNHHFSIVVLSHHSFCCCSGITCYSEIEGRRWLSTKPSGPCDNSNCWYERLSTESVRSLLLVRDLQGRLTKRGHHRQNHCTVGYLQILAGDNYSISRSDE